MPEPISLVELHARLRALEFMTVLNEVTEAAEAGGELRQYVAEQRNKLTQIGRTLSEIEEDPERKAAMERAFDHLGDLLEAMGQTVAEGSDRKAG